MPQGADWLQQKSAGQRPACERSRKLSSANASSTERRRVAQELRQALAPRNILSRSASRQAADFNEARERCSVSVGIVVRLYPGRIWQAGLRTMPAGPTVC